LRQYRGADEPELNGAVEIGSSKLALDDGGGFILARRSGSILLVY